MASAGAVAQAGMQPILPTRKVLGEMGFTFWGARPSCNGIVESDERHY